MGENKNIFKNSVKSLTTSSRSLLILSYYLSLKLFDYKLV
jgi:hypothetical protein